MPEIAEDRVQKVMEEFFEFYFFYPLFDEDDVEETLFDDFEIPNPEIDWYIAFLNARDKVIDWSETGKYKKNVLLTKEQEKRLFLQYNYAKYRFTMLREGRKTKSNKTKMIYWYDTAIRLRMHIAAMNLSMVVKMVRRVKQHSDVSEFLSAGNERIMIAIEGFDVSQGNKFSTYAWPALQRCMLREREKMAKRQDFCPFSLDLYIGDDEHDSNGYQPPDVKQEDDKERDDNIEALGEIMGRNLAELNEREVEVIRWRFLERKEAGRRYGLEEVGKMLGVSRTCIQLTERDAIKKLRKAWHKHVS